MKLIVRENLKGIWSDEETINDYTFDIEKKGVVGSLKSGLNFAGEMDKGKKVLTINFVRQVGKNHFEVFDRRKIQLGGEARFTVDYTEMTAYINFKLEE